MRDQHGDVIAHAGLVAFDGQVVSRFDGFARLPLLGFFLVEQAQAVKRVGDLMRGVQHGLVVIRHREVRLGAAAREIGVEFAAMEDGQRDGGAEACHASVGAQQVAGADGLEANERGQVHVGIKLRFGAVDGMARGFGAPAGGSDVRAVPQQIERDAGGYGAGGRGQRHRGQRLTALRARACKCGDLVAQLRQRGLGLGQFHFAGGKRGFRLLDLDLGVQPG
ncbi:hypothetical protein D3C86_1228100 [compost metagenome]